MLVSDKSHVKHGKTYLFAKSLFSVLVGLGEKFEFFEVPSIDKGQFDKAYLNLTKAIELKPDKITKSLAYAFRGQVNHVKNGYPQAMTDLDQAIKLNPNLSIAYYLRGRVHLERGNRIAGYNPSYFEVAVIDFSQAISLKSDYVEAYYARGLAYSVLINSDHLSRSDFKKSFRDK